MPLATMRLSYYPNENDRSRKADYIVINALITHGKDGESSEVVAKIEAPYLTEPVEISLLGMPSKPDFQVVCWAVLSAFAVGAGAGDKELVVSLRDKKPVTKPSPKAAP